MNSNNKKKSKKTKAGQTENTKLSSQPDDGDQRDSQENMEVRFEQELMWCVEQLQLGLATQNPDSRQAKEATKVLKILLSSKAPLVKKRQVMRNTFGDYRKKMKDQERKSAAAAKKMKLLPVKEKGCQKSQFFRKSAKRTMGEKIKGTGEHSGKQAKGSGEQAKVSGEQVKVSGEQEKGSGEQSNQEKQFDDSALDLQEAADMSVDIQTCGDIMVDNTMVTTDALNTSFKFNFKLDDDTNAAAYGTDEPGCSGLGECDGVAQEQSFKFSKSDNTFRFKFSAEDGQS